MGARVFLNGELVDRHKASISVFDHGVLYGDGVFEGIRSYSRKIFRFDEHIDRLFKSAEDIRIKIPCSKERMKEHIITTLRENGLDDAYIRAVVTRGVGDLGLDPRKCAEPTVFIITDKISLYPDEFYEKGLKIIIAETRRNHPQSLNPRIKSLNYLNNIMGKINAMDAGVEEALMLSVEGYVAECTGDNIFIVKDGKLLTPYYELGTLEGITQKVVIELAEKRGMAAEFKKMRPDEIFSADECFLTGTAAEIIPVTSVGDNIIGAGIPGDITVELLGDFRTLTREEGAEY